MHVFTVDVDHIDALLTAGLAFTTPERPLTWYHPAPQESDAADLSAFAHVLTLDTAGRVGAMLLAENTRSTNHVHHTNDWEVPYLFQALPGKPDPVVVLKAITCLEHQSCAHPGWTDSEALVFCDALRHLAIAQLPGWASLDDTAWPIRGRDIFDKQPRP